MKTGPKNYTFLLYTILFEVGHLERCDKYLEMPCLQKSNHGKQRHASYSPLFCTYCTIIIKVNLPQYPKMEPIVSSQCHY